VTTADGLVVAAFAPHVDLGLLMRGGGPSSPPEMDLTADYREKGFTVVRGLVAREVANGFARMVQEAFAKAGQAPLVMNNPAVTKPAIELYAYHFRPMLTFLWGLTPAASALAGRDLLPAYAYMRVYQKGDVLRVHSDRPACEHSMSLTLATSEALSWPLEIGLDRLADVQPLQEDFGDAPHLAINLDPGDALLYQGFHHAHGRTQPNPNRWSAHLFLHWVDRGGPHAAHAYDGKTPLPPEDFSFAAPT
jgi:hypothetical protein